MLHAGLKQRKDLRSPLLLINCSVDDSVFFPSVTINMDTIGIFYLNVGKYNQQRLAAITDYVNFLWRTVLRWPWFFDLYMILASFLFTVSVIRMKSDLYGMFSYIHEICLGVQVYKQTETILT